MKKLDPRVTAIEELVWRFEVADSAMGMHGQSYDCGGGGGSGFDSASRKHEARANHRHRDAVNKSRRIDAILQSIGEQGRELSAVFAPIGRATEDMTKAFTVFVEGRPVCVLATALAMSRAEFVSSGAMSSGQTLVEFLWLRYSAKGDRGRGRAYADNRRDDAERSLVAALEAYAKGSPTERVECRAEEVPEAPLSDLELAHEANEAAIRVMAGGTR